MRKVDNKDKFTPEVARRINIIVEDFHSKLDIVVEGIAGLTESHNNFKDETRSNFREVSKHLDKLEAEVTELRKVKYQSV